MAATVIINRLTGAGPTETAITGGNTRASCSDAPSPGTSDPVPIPAAGTNYSWWVVTQLDATVAPAGTIDNIRWYSDGSDTTGTGVGINGNKATAYTQATGTSTSGTQLTVGNYPSVTTPVSVFTFTSGSPQTLSGSQTGTGAFGDRFVYQFSVGTSAGPGITTSETFTWVYDET